MRGQEKPKPIPIVPADAIDPQDILICVHQNEERDCGGMRVFVCEVFAEMDLTPEVLRELLDNVEASLLHTATERGNLHFPRKQ